MWYTRGGLLFTAMHQYVGICYLLTYLLTLGYPGFLEAPLLTSNRVKFRTENSFTYIYN